MGSKGGGLGGSLFGTGQSAGMLGTGQYRSDAYSTDASAFAPDDNEQQLIKALQGQAYGTAPSAAQLQMQQGVQAASQQANAIAASQRGIDPALAARMAAQSQASIAQQANGQGAIMRAQEQQSGLNSLTGELQSVRGARENLQGLNAANYNSNNQINAQAYEGAANRRQNFNQGIMSMANGLSGMMGAKGGMATHDGFVRPMAEGGAVDPSFAGYLAAINGIGRGVQATPLQASGQSNQAAKKFGQNIGKLFKSKPQTQTVSGGPMDSAPATDSVGMPDSGTLFAADGGEVDDSDNGPSLETPVKAPTGGDSFSQPQMGGGGISVTPLKESGQKSGGGGGGGMMSGIMKLIPLIAAMGNGGQVPGQAQVKGDSLQNDKVPAVLSPGEIVIPRSIVANGPDAAKRFVAAILKQKKGA